MESFNEKSAKKRLELIRDIKEVWSTNAGERVLLEIIKDSGAMGDPQSNSGQAMAYNVGRSSLGKELIQCMIYAGIELSTRECLGISDQDIKDYKDKALSTIKGGENVRTRSRKP